MSKRKQGSKEDSDDSGDDVNLIDVDFDFFNPNPAVDYHALKRLIAQLFQSDADLFHLHDLTELVLSQSAVGTTIKTDGMESDPYALLTVLNMHVHQNHPSIQALSQYILQKSSQAADPALHATLQSLFSQSQNHVGFILCERLINMPVQVIPPMYRMLNDEIKLAIDENEPYRFTHFIIISRTYHLSEAEETALASNSNSGPTSKRAKKSQARVQGQGPADGIYSFHPEDEVIMELASQTINYPFTHSPPTRDAESFGLDNRGRLMLVPAENFPELAKRMGERYAVPPS